jgi:hypothetical protein
MMRRRRLFGLVLGVAATLGVGALLFALRPRTRYVYPAEYQGSTLVLRVLDEHGPVSGRELEVDVESRSGDWGSGGVSDEDGILRVSVGKSFVARDLQDILPDWQEPPADITVRVSDERSFGHLERTGTLPAGEVDLGDVVLQPKPLLAEGRVTDGDGEPVAGARVYVSADDGVRPRPAETDENGAFLLVASAGSTAGPRRLVAIQGERFSEARAIEPGASDVQLVLSQTRVFGSFQGRVVLDPDVPRERIAVSLMPIDFYGHLLDQGIDFQRSPDADGEFLFEKCLAGEHVLRVSLHHRGHFDGEDLVVLRDVVTQAGVQSTDPRCQPVDLRGKIHAFRLTVIAPDGTPAPYGKVLVDGRRRALPPLSFWTDLDMPTHLVLTTETDADIDVRVPGYQSVHLDDVSEDRTIELHSGLPLRLVLPEDIELPPAHVTWSVLLHGDRVDVPDEPATFEPGSRELRVIAAEPGTVEVEWIRTESLGDDRVRASAWGAREGEPRQRLQIRDVPEEQVFELLPLAPP